MKAKLKQRILTIWEAVETDFPDKSTEFLMEMTCQRYAMQYRQHLPIDCGDVAEALTEKMEDSDWCRQYNEACQKIAVMDEEATQLRSALAALQSETQALRAERDEALRDYESALGERNKAWRKADEIEADNASRKTRDEYREREVKKLTATIAALEDKLDSAHTLKDQLDTLTALCDGQKAELAKAREDTERLDWFETEKPTLLCLVKEDESGRTKPVETYWEINNKSPFVTARAAIDAARQPGTGGKET